MRFKLYMLISLWLVASCKSKLQDAEPPVGILDKETMINIMVDVHLAESYGYMLRLTSEEKNEIEKVEYAKVLKTHGVNEKDFKLSYNWYISNPIVFDAMYDEIIERINMQEQFAPEHLDEDENLEAGGTESGKMYAPPQVEEIISVETDR